jgi:hypothetical protein
MNNHTSRPKRNTGETYLILFYQILIDTLAIRNVRI